MCTQEEERLKKAHGGSLNFVQHNKRKKFHDKNARPQGKPYWERGSSSNPSDKFQKKDPQQANQMNACGATPRHTGRKTAQTS